MSHDVYIVYEDPLGKAVIARLLREARPDIKVNKEFNGGGCSGIRKNFQKYCGIATRHTVVLLTDLDAADCAVSLIDEWRDGRTLPEKLIFRVAVRETESWLLADYKEFPSFLGNKNLRMPTDPDKLVDPKKELLKLAQKATRDVAFDMVPSEGSIRKVGPAYNSRLTSFVNDLWCPERAAERSESLRRARNRLADALR